MSIQITNNGASIKITNGALIRNVTKSQIIEVSVIKATILKIDIGQGALHNIFIPYLDVTVPVTANIGLLRDAINDFMAPASGGSGVGSATEAKQIEEIDILNNMNASFTIMRGLVTTLDNKIFYEPSLVDDGGAGVIYNGYALLTGALDTEPIWAIQRIQKVGDVDVYTWADGNKNFDNSWIDRETLTYA
jgi:hypothetical protein